MYSKEILGLVRSPLGIIALFMVLVYSIAGAVMGVSIAALSENQTWVLLVFVVSFPVVLLATFTWLVVFHHEKLYGPSDFRADDSFIRLANAEEQRESLSREIDELSMESSRLTGESNQSRRPSLDDRLDAEKEYLYATTLAFKALEQEYKQSIKREVRVPLESGAHEIFDGAFEAKSGMLHVFEVKLVPATKAADSLKKIFDQALNLSQYYGDVPYQLSLVLVVTGDNAKGVEAFRRRVEDVAGNYVNDFNIVHFSIFELQSRFGVRGLPKYVATAN